MKIFIGNLDRNTTEYQVYSLFSDYGVIEGVVLPRDKVYEPRGFGYVLMRDRLDAENAIRGLDKKMFNEQYISVSESMHDEKFSDTLVY